MLGDRRVDDEIPLDLLPVTKQKPHKHVTIGFCRKQQVSSVTSEVGLGISVSLISKARTQRELLINTLLEHGWIFWQEIQIFS